MKRLILSCALTVASIVTVFAQKERIKFEEYDLPNGLHVILHQDKSTPIVSVSIMYHVGSKNEDPKRTGFAHFFEHLLFEGSPNIGRGEFMKIVQENGGVLNANTSHDRTYYFEVLPSNQLELGLWLESERLFHAKIDSIGIETQRKVVKEEKKESYDNRPYGQLMDQVFSNMYSKHPYQWMPIGKEQYIDAAKFEEFMDFYKTFYVPNNAVLVIAGDFETANAKQLIEKYFGDIPKGTKPIPRPNIVEPAKTKEKRATFHDDVPLPAVVLAFGAPEAGSKDYYALDLLTKILSSGASSRFQMEIVDKQQKAVQVAAVNYPLEDPGMIMMFAVGNRGIQASELEKAMKTEVEKLKANGVTPAEFEKAINSTETQFISSFGSLSTIAENLATNYTYFRNTNLINTELEVYQQLTIDDIKRVANKYLNKENSLVLYYLPKK